MLITPAEWRSQPWKNGLGVTHEVWRDRDDYDVRVSVAEDVTPAPFSRFPGYLLDPVLWIACDQDWDTRRRLAAEAEAIAKLDNKRK